jgi:mono/diheme cytochrome c family protein
MRYFLILAVIMLILSVGCANRSPSPGPENEEVGLQAETSVAEGEAVGVIDPTANLDQGDAEIGREYFYGENRGRCLDCHTLNGEGEAGGYALDDVGLRRDPEWLAIFINNPRDLRPEVARMPPYRGDEEGATIADIVAFLMTLKTPVEHPESGDVKPEGEPEAHYPENGGHGGGHGSF